MTDLASKSCAACDGWTPPLSDAEITALKAELHPGWDMDRERTTLSRRFTFKGFAKAVYMANPAAYVSDREGHHADVAFGWGYCVVAFTSHELGRLSENDFICAVKLDAATV